MPPPSDSMLTALLAEQDWVRRLARGLASDAARADDLAQESWLAALRHPPRDARNLRAWFARVVKSQARDAARGDARRRRREEEHARELGLSADSVAGGARASEHAAPHGFAAHGGTERSPAEAVERAELVRALVDAVMALHEPYKSALVLVYFEHLAPKDAAARLDLPDATLRSHVKRGLELVRARLDREHGGSRDAWLAGVLALATEPPAPFMPGDVVRAPRTPSEAARTPQPVAHSRSLPTHASKEIPMTWKLTWKLAAALVLAVSGSITASSFLRAPSTTSAPSAPSSSSLASTNAPLPGPERPARGLATDTPPIAALQSAPALDVQLVWERDGALASGVLVFVDHRDAFDRTERLGTISDAAGHARFAAVPIGHLDVRTDRGGRASLEHDGSMVLAATLAIPRGVTVRGRVTEHDGRAAAGAEVFLAPRGSQGEHLAPAALADADGRFELRDVEMGAHVGARESGRAPSNAFEVRGEPDATQECVLVLLGPGGALEGTVRDPGGAPIANARVLAGATLAGYGARIANPLESAQVAPRRVVLTDDEGHYLLDGLAPGSNAVRVLASGFPEYASTLVVAVGAATALDVTLTPAARLAGRVLDASGAPVAGCRVQLERWNEAGYARTDTDALGCFAIEGLAAGTPTLRAFHPVLGRVLAQPVLALGSETTLELTLDPGRTITGRVEDALGHPLAGWRVRVNEEWETITDAEFDEWIAWNGIQRSSDARTDADGRFALCNLPAWSVGLEVRPTNLGPQYGQPAFAMQVQAPAHDLVLRVDASVQPTAWITGTVADEDGHPVGAAQLYAVNTSAVYGGVATIATIEPATGRFRAGPLVAGEYRVSARAPGLVPTELGPWTVQGEELAVGEQRLRFGGTLRVTLLHRDSVSRSVSLQLDGASSGDLELAYDRALSSPLAPGGYTVLVAFDQVPRRDRPFPVVVQARQETTLEIDLASFGDH
ncbi:MAG: sigma-70 family RNA polymerase sigma factor [Planctomycetes bacterium]|nr:sigma-70 family RNA polymerase sigma factor [Planctomycetota bacterium]